MNDPILLAESDPIFGDLLEAYLAGRGYGVVRVCDGRRALDALRGTRLKAAIVAMELPGLDGLELAASLDEGAPPVLLTTRTPLPPAWTADKLRQIGLSAVIRRPCPMLRIVEALESFGERAKPAAPLASASGAASRESQPAPAE